MGQLERGGATFPDGSEGRIYWNPDEPECLFPSVTTVTGRHESEEKERAIQGWRRKNNGKNGNPDHEHLWWYSGPRGTLVHWYIQTHFLDTDLASDEELDSLTTIEDRDTDYEYVYSIAKNHDGVVDFPSEDSFYSALENDSTSVTTLTDILWDDAQWCLEAFTDLLPRTGLADVSFAESDCLTIEKYFSKHVRTENVIHVEKFVNNENPKYAGQLDFLYERPNSDVVLADLKTTSGVYWTHRRQLEAYARALDRPIDDMEVIRMQPDKRETQLSRFSRWGDSHDELWSDFCVLHDEIIDLVESGDVTVEGHPIYGDDE